MTEFKLFLRCKRCKLSSLDVVPIPGTRAANLCRNCFQRNRQEDDLLAPKPLPLYKGKR